MISISPVLMLLAAFSADVRTVHLPGHDVRAVVITADGTVYAGTSKGLIRFSGSRWTAIEGLTGAPVDLLTSRGKDLLVTFKGSLRQLANGRLSELARLPSAELRSLAAGRTVLLATATGLFELAGGQFVERQKDDVRQVALRTNGDFAVAAASGLYLNSRPLYPREGSRSWAPYDVRGVAFDARGRLWFASPQGAGCLEKEWMLYTGYEGLPYDDFTTLAPGEDGVIWLGTTKGAIRYDGKDWEYRQGLRWLPDDLVRGIAVTREGHAWFATPKGVSVIERRSMTLAEKAKFFEDEIDLRHRRTPYGYVLAVNLKRPGDKSEWVQHDSDNDGLWTSMYGAGECFAYAATKDPAAKRRARAAFEALRFLGTVTQGGEHPAPPGFVARSILPANGPDPNAHDSPQRDEEHRARDPLWKVLSPRWPRSADGKWYWKSDTSSDELDGHYFFYAQYYDLAAETPEEKEDVRRVVKAITDHLLAHNFALVDWDGRPTRWAIYSPEVLNQDFQFWDERGLNSLSILSYLKVAEYMTGDEKYRRASEKLIKEHHYATNVMVPKIRNGIGSGNQSDDEMAFMSFYNLLKYEADPALRNMYGLAFSRYWQEERMELNPLFNFLYGDSSSIEESMDTLRRYPLDRVDWRLTNSHRKDIIMLADSPGRGYRKNGKVLPIDERWVEHWNQDPFRLDQGGRGLVLSDGTSFLLPYYLGLYRGLVL